MKLTINGTTREARAETLAALLEAEGLGAARVATAVNGSFVPADQRAAAALHDGDRIEIVAPMQGG